MENGRPVYSIIQELKTAPLDSLDEVIRGVAGSSVNEESFCVWKGDGYSCDVFVLSKGSHLQCQRTGNANVFLRKRDWVKGKKKFCSVNIEIIILYVLLRP